MKDVWHCEEDRAFRQEEGEPGGWAKMEHEAMAKMDKKPAGTTFLGKGDGIETCPVTGEPVSKDLKVEVMGRTVYVCCAGCLEKVKKNPELYIRK
ncbi:MAG: hypothetical protein IPG76_10660 [Acidobacteria bacterium]|nr:hypothetical protein [Acidobacteriota bacterium]